MDSDMDTMDGIPEIDVSVQDESDDDIEDSRNRTVSIASSGPWRGVKFSVQKALNGTFFKPVSANEEDLRQQIRSKSIKVYCLKCAPSVPERSKRVTASTSSNSNLFTHMKRHHDATTLDNFKRSLESAREEFVALNPGKVGQTRLRRSQSTESYQAQFEKLIIDYVIHAMIPLQAIEDPSFKRIFDFLHVERKGLRLISRRTLGRRLDDIFASTIVDIKASFNAIPWVCTTADIWSGGKRSFLGVTAHWIDDQNSRKSVALACRRFTGQHTHDKIAGLLQEIHESFGLSTRKIVATVTDNGSNFVKAFQVFGVHQDDQDTATDSEDTENQGNWVTVEELVRLPNHLRCAAHTLALSSTSDVLKAIKSKPDLWALHEVAIKKCGVLWKLANRPRSAEIILSVTGKSLSRPTETRWNSLYDSLKQVIDARRFMEELWQRLNIPQVQTISDGEFTYLEEYVKCSQPVANALDLLQGEATAYYGTMVPTILALRKKLHRSISSEWRFCLPVAEAYLQSVEKRFSQFLNFDTQQARDAAVAALSFPKFKNRWFPCIQKQTQDGLLSLFKAQIVEYLVSELGENASAGEEMDAEPPLDEFYDFGEDEEQDCYPQNDVAAMAQSIMDKYLGDQKCGLETLNDYPAIQHIFKKTNTPLPSSAQVERLFSYATMTNLPKCNRLSNEKFEQRVILKANASFTV